jgi:threonine dehydratase
MMQQAQALDATFDLVLAPVSGGGLLAGVSEVVKSLSPATEAWGVEPALFDDLRQSLEVGERVAIKPTGRSLCDALESPAPGEITFPMLKKNLAGAVDVTDPEVTDAMRYAFGALKLVVEPGGSAGLAALLAGKIAVQGKTVGLVLSGGNVDPDLFAKVIRGEI